MKCPMRYKIEKHAATFVEFEFPDCLKEECAWWSLKRGRCVILAYEEACDKLAEAVRVIASKISLGGVK